GKRASNGACKLGGRERSKKTPLLGREGRASRKVRRRKRERERCSLLRENVSRWLIHAAPPLSFIVTFLGPPRSRSRNETCVTTLREHIYNTR
ncbi:hypothetical protein ALC62_04483, partial [Cyphomyrmex costatus]